MSHFKERQTIAGRYRLEKQLAKGGMGSVWIARNLQLDIPVAVKFMSPETIGSAELVSRFEREARAAAQLRSPQVVHIYEHGVVEGTPFMVMELLEGEDLSKRLRTRGRLPMAETARVVIDICKALRRAHEQGIVHRDLKPGNVFLARQDEEEIVKVLDFGIAKVLSPSPEEEVTKTGALVGTPHYMSPEQARRTQKDVDHRTDLWALGVIAYRALTGRLPFAGETSIDVLIKVCNDNEPIPPPSSIASDLGPDVDRFFARALARSPEARFQSAREFAEAMNALAGRGGADIHPLARSWSGESPALRAAPAPAPSQPALGAAPPRVLTGSPLEVHVPRVLIGAPPAYPPALDAAMQNASFSSGPRAPAPPGLPAIPRPDVPRAPSGEPALQHVEPLDPLDVAKTVPITRSPAGQAIQRAAGLVPEAPAPQMALPLNRTQPLPSFGPPSPQPGGLTRQTTGAGLSRQVESSPSQPGPAAYAAVAGDVAGTLTGAGTETPPPLGTSSRRTSGWIVAGALCAVLVVVLVVGWAVIIGTSNGTESPESASSLIPIPSGSAGPTPVASETAPAMSSSASSAPATASVTSSTQAVPSAIVTPSSATSASSTSLPESPSQTPVPGPPSTPESPPRAPDLPPRPRPTKQTPTAAPTASVWKQGPLF